MPDEPLKPFISFDPNSVLMKTLFCGVVSFAFVFMFINSWHLPWEEKYRHFTKNAMQHPGGDLRAIQMKAYCDNFGQSYASKEDCYRQIKPIKEHYSIVWDAPAYNYPQHWANIYNFFDRGGNSETEFRRFWTVNALLLVLGILIYCYRYNHLALPIFLFSPPTLLAIERGNTDAAVFFLTFVPLLVFSSSKLLQGFFLGLATALKIFPVFGYLAFLRKRPHILPKSLVLGALLAAPLLISTALDIPRYIQTTARGFGASYGLMSLMHPEVNLGTATNPELVAYGLITLFLVGVGVCGYWYWRNPALQRSVHDDLVALDPNERIILLVSASIYMGTFLFIYTNWAYRLVFLIPMFLILSRGRSLISKLICINILAVFWLPHYSWRFQSWASFPLAIWVGCLLAGSYKCLATEKKP